MPEKCDADEITKQIKVIDTLRRVRDLLADKSIFDAQLDMNGETGKLDTMISEQEAKLQATIDECGNIEADELPLSAEDTGGI